MTETSRFWDGIATGDATTAPYDGPTEFATVMSAIAFCDAMTDKGGVWLDGLNDLSCSSPGANTQRIANGKGMVYGGWYSNDSNVDVTIATPSGSTRVDRIVLRKSWAAQTIRVTRIAGVEGAGAPSLVQTIGTTWDVPLHQVSITTGGVMTVIDQRTFIHGLAGAGALLSSGGVLTMPSQPAVLAYPAASATNQTGNGAIVTVPFTTEVFDNAGNFSASTFTSPITGKVLVATGVVISNLSTAMKVCSLKVVTSNRSTAWEQDVNVETAGDTWSINWVGILDVDAGDTVSVTVQVSGGAGNTATIFGIGGADMGTYFSCTLLPA